MFALRRHSISLFLGIGLVAIPARTYAETFQTGLFNQSSNQAFANSRNFQFLQQLNQLSRTFKDVQGFSLLAQAGNNLFVKSKTTGLPIMRLLLRNDGIFAQNTNNFGQPIGNFFRAPREASHQALEFFATNQQNLGRNALNAFRIAAVNELNGGRGGFSFGDVTFDCNAGVTPQSRVNTGDPANPSFKGMASNVVCAKTLNYILGMISNPAVKRGPRIQASDIGANGKIKINLLKFMKPEHVALLKAKNYKTCDGLNANAAMSVGDLAQIAADPANYNIFEEIDKDPTETYRRLGVNMNFPRRFMGPNNPFARLTDSVLLTQAQTSGTQTRQKGDADNKTALSDLDGSGVSTGTARLAQRFVKNFGLPFYITTDKRGGASGTGQVGSAIISQTGVAGYQGDAEEAYGMLQRCLPIFILSTTPQNDGLRKAQIAAPAEIALTAHSDPRLKSVLNGVMCTYCHNNFTASNGEKPGKYATNITGPGLNKDGMRSWLRNENKDADRFRSCAANENINIARAGNKNSLEPLAFDAYEKQVKAMDLRFADRELGVPSGTVERLVKKNPQKWRPLLGIASDQPLNGDSLVRRENWVGGAYCDARAALSNQNVGNNRVAAQGNGNRNIGLRGDTAITHKSE